VIGTSMFVLQQDVSCAWRGQVGSIFCGLGWVSHLWFGLKFGKFQQITSNFSIFFPSGQKKSLWVRSESTWVKAGSASYLLRVKSKLGSGRVGSRPISKYCYVMKRCQGLTHARIWTPDPQISSQTPLISCS